jgi:hypothetical protein
VDVLDLGRWQQQQKQRTGIWIRKQAGRPALPTAHTT